MKTLMHGVTPVLRLVAVSEADRDAAPSMR